MQSTLWLFVWMCLPCTVFPGVPGSPGREESSLKPQRRWQVGLESVHGTRSQRREVNSSE